MADVNLEIAVKNTGITGAILALENLQKAGKLSGEALDRVTVASQILGERLARNISRGGATATLSGIDKAAASTTAALSALNKQYNDLARANPNASAPQRLASFESISPGAIAQIERLTAAQNASALGDKNDVRVQKERELAVATRATNDAKAAQLALQERLSGRAAANQNVTQAREDYAAQTYGLGQVDKATIELARAKTALAAAQQAVRATGISGDNAQRTVALNEEAGAIRRVINAQEGLNASLTSGASAGNAFQSSFSYFAIASFADRIGQALLNVGEEALSTSSKMERAFADVNRTFDGTATELSGLRATLIDLSTSTPNSFVDLANIASLGNQLGVASENIQAFTTTIAQYSTISGESADTAATAFGKIGNLTGLAASEYSNLGSSIEYVARTTAATEASISSTSKEIAALASGAGFSAQAIVGLSGAMSSLSIPPERARGALSLYFGALNRSIAEGGTKLAAFSTITGIAKDQLGQLVANNQGQQVFSAFLSGLSDLNSVAKSVALKEVGLSTIRVDQTMRALAQNVPLVTQSFQGAALAFQQNTELAHQYSIIQATVASKYAELQNAASNAAGALGDAFNTKELRDFLTALTEIVVNFARFAESDPGKAFIRVAGGIGIFVGVITTAIGALALLKAAQVLVPWALTGLQAKGAEGAIIQFVRALLNVPVASAAAATGLAGTEVALDATAVAATRLSAAARITRFALIGIGAVGIAFAIIGTIAEAFGNAENHAKSATAAAKDFFGGSYASIGDALVKDQVAYAKTGQALQIISTSYKDNSRTASEWVSSLQSATGAQVALDKSTTDATNTIKNQTIAYGPNAKEALANSLANAKSFRDLFKNTKANAALASTGFDTTDFAQAILTDPKAGGKAYVDKYVTELSKSIGGSRGQVESLLKTLGNSTGLERDGQHGILSKIIFGQGADAGALALKLEPFAQGFYDISKSADASSTAVQKEAERTAASTATHNALLTSLNQTGDGFLGATDSLSAFQNALQSGLSTALGFSTILQTITTNAGKKTGLINADTFNAELQKANAGAVTFFNGITQLANNGSSSFATQLAALGPAAQGILSTALSASPETRQALEANARFAAFLASDEFKKSFAAQMKNSDAAYAQILAGGGNLQDVQNYIHAQVTGVATEYEKAWDMANPKFPLNVSLTGLTQADLDLYSQTNSGRLTITATVIPASGGRGPGPQNTFTDNASGASITLPATLDQAALSASLKLWEANEGSTPSQIAALLNTGTFSSDVNAWVAAHGPITVTANLVPTGSSLLNLRVLANSHGLVGANSKGGLLDGNGQGHPAFAGGGMFQGGGTGTSDSLWAKVSRGEFVQTADSTNYWGPDFMESLNRKMLPASIVSMLSAAAGSGSSGPSHVAYVNVQQNNPLTQDPLKQLRASSEMVAAGIWGAS